MKVIRFGLLAIIGLGVGLPAAGGITYTCDPSINSDAYSNLCATLNGTTGTAFAGGLAGIYNSTFTNANATIYISFNSAVGLGESTFGVGAIVPYSTYQTQLQTESTDAAKTTLPASEPSLYSGGQILLTNALENALGFAGNEGVEFNASNPGTGFAGSVCSNPGNGAVVVAGPTACYNGIITLDTPANLASSLGQGYTYRGLGGSTTGTTNNYDIFSVIEHETDEVLGTASCVTTSTSPITDACATGPHPGFENAAAVDLFRYSAPGTRTFGTVGGTAYFSANGGTTDLYGNTYNTSDNGDDWADFTNNCTFVQDGVGCLNQSFDITTDGPGNTAGPEEAILNAVGYNLQQTAPEPGTLGLLGVSLVALAIQGKRLHRNKK